MNDIKTFNINEYVFTLIKNNNLSFTVNILNSIKFSKYSIDIDTIDDSSSFTDCDNNKELSFDSIYNLIFNCLNKKEYHTIKINNLINYTNKMNKDEDCSDEECGNELEIKFNFKISDYIFTYKIIPSLL